MSVAVKTTPEPTSAEVPEGQVPVYRFTVEKYQQMIETGVLTTNDRVELLEGLIVEMMTQNPPHAVAIDRAQEVLRTLLPPGWRLREQKPITLADSQPEPDLAIVRGPADRYLQRHPVPADIALIIEVADTTLVFDRVPKGRLYARSRIPVYWIINLVERQVEIYSQPKAGKSPSYRQRLAYHGTQAVPLVIKGRKVGQIAVKDLLPGGKKAR